MTRRKNSIATVTPIREDAAAAPFPEEAPDSATPLQAFEQEVQQTLAAVVPGPKPRAPTQRRVSAEVVKAETKLLSLERRRKESLEHHDEVWASKRALLIQGFPGDVLGALEAMGVLVEDESEPGA